VAALVLAAIGIALAAVLREPADPQARNWFSQTPRDSGGSASSSPHDTPATRYSESA